MVFVSPILESVFSEITSIYTVAHRLISKRVLDTCIIFVDKVLLFCHLSLLKAAALKCMIVSVHVLNLK